MKNFINFLPPWVETNLQPAFYDLESGTSLQQTSRMYAKVNQLVRTVNEQNETIADYIQQFIDLRDHVDEYFDNLDVQEEINNKLNAMTEDGSLAHIINNDVFGLIEESINNLSDDVDSKISALQDHIDNTFAEYESGAPVVVTSAESMTDHNKIYLLTSDMNLYYWNGTQFAIAGSYTPATLTSDSVGNKEVSTIDTSKITDNGFYTSRVLSDDSMGVSRDGKTISYSANQGVVFPESTRSGFDFYLPITPEMVSQTGFVVHLNIDSDNEFYVQLPDFNYFNITPYENGNDKLIQIYGNPNLTTYLTNNVGKYLKIRLEFKNESGVSATIKINYAGAVYQAIVNELGEFIGSNPTIQSSNGVYVPYNYSETQFTFKSIPTAGIEYKIPLSMFDKTKPTFITAQTISGDPVRVFLVIDHSNGTAYIAKTTPVNGVYSFTTADYGSFTSITSVKIRIASVSNASININNPAITTISIPVYTQAPFAGSYQKTLEEISSKIHSSSANRLLNKSMLVYGDSTAYGHTLDRDVVWDSLIATRNNMTLTNHAQNGKFITRNQFVNGAATPYTQAELDGGTVSNIAVVDNVNTNLYTGDYIIVCAGTNDMMNSITLGSFGDNNYNTFYGALDKTINYLLDNNPTKNIMFITPMVRLNNYNHDLEYINAIVKVCEKYSVDCFNSNKLGICRSNEAQKSALMLDNTHLNQAGQLKASYRYEAELMIL